MIPPIRCRPGRRGGRGARLHRRAARGLHLRPTADLGRWPDVGSARRRRAFADFHRLTALDELAWRMRIEGSRGLPEREFNGPVVGLQERYREGLAALGAELPRRRPRGAGGPPACRPRLQRPPLRARLRGDVRRARVRGEPGPASVGRPSASPATSSPGAGPTRRCPTRDRRRRHRRLGARRRHRGRRADRGRLDGDHRREGPEPPARPRRPEPARLRLLERRDQVPQPALPRPRPAGRAPDLPDRGGRRGPRCTSARSTRCRPRSAEAGPTPTARCPVSARTTSGSCPSSVPSPAPTWPTGRSTTTSSSRTTPRWSGPSGWPAPRGQPLRRTPVGTVPHAVGRSDVRRHPVGGRRREARLPPLPGADRGQQRSLRRPAGLQQLRLLRLLRLSDPRQGRPRRHAAADHGDRPGRAAGRDLRVPDPHRGPDGPPGST